MMISGSCFPMVVDVFFLAQTQRALINEQGRGVSIGSLANYILDQPDDDDEKVGTPTRR